MDFEELRRLYDRSRFVVIPLMETDTDNGTTSILEAMATGNAVICSRVHGQRDVLRDGETGIFVPPRDPRALRDAIEHLWNNPDKAREMGNRAREYIERHHTLDAWVGHVRLIVDDVLAERKRQPDVGRHGWHRHHKPQIAEKGTECLPTVEKSPAEGFVP
jgi:glycosyltransferase involved in cell wall biosynthesis